MPGISIIIPTLNEAKYIRQTLTHLQELDPAPHEIIVVDGGSTDHTLDICRSYPVKVICCQRSGRAFQLNSGASLATGEILCFLHADTMVPLRLVAMLDDTLKNDRIALGGFIAIMGYAGKTHWFTTWLNFSKTYFGPLLYSPYQCLFKGMRLLFGDQVMFCRKNDFFQVGGFDADLPIMEEADLCRKMNRLGRIKQIRQRVYTSDRRIVYWGFWKAHAIYIGIFLLWVAGVSPYRLKKFYEEVR
jgi:rSAM/selenodomain-associated transferase 2